MARWQYQAKVEPIVVSTPVVVTPLSWLGSFPAQFNKVSRLNAGTFDIDSKQLTLKQQVYISEWLPTYPSRIESAKRIVNVNLSTEDWLGHRPISSALSGWRPLFPDIIRRKRELVNTGFFTVDPRALTRKETVSFDKWQPIYPNRLDKLPRPILENRAYVFFPPVAPFSPFVDKWLPTYPVIIDKKQNRNFAYIRSIIGEFPIPPVVPVSYGDYIRTYLGDNDSPPSLTAAPSGESVTNSSYLNYMRTYLGDN